MCGPGDRLVVRGQAKPNGGISETSSPTHGEVLTMHRVAEGRRRGEVVTMILASS